VFQQAYKRAKSRLILSLIPNSFSIFGYFIFKSRRFCIGGKAAISPPQLALAVFEKFLLKAQHMYG
jgi:hypothetical protein